MRDCQMLIHRAVAILGLAAAFALLGGTQASAEDKPAHQGGGHGGGGRWDPAQMQQRRLDSVKQAMAPTDEEWATLKPLVLKVQEVSSRERQGRVSPFRRGRRGGSTENAAEKEELSALEKCVKDLQAVLANKDAKPEELAEKLKALREAREKVQEEMTAAQEELRKAATPRQEAQLVLLGLLD